MINKSKMQIPKCTVKNLNCKMVNRGTFNRDRNDKRWTTQIGVTRVLQRAEIVVHFLHTAQDFYVPIPSGLGYLVEVRSIVNCQKKRQDDHILHEFLYRYTLQTIVNPCLVSIHHISYFLSFAHCSNYYQTINVILMQLLFSTT